MVRWSLEKETMTVAGTDVDRRLQIPNLREDADAPTSTQAGPWKPVEGKEKSGCALQT